MRINFNKIKIGDRLVRNKGGIFTKHHALYVGFWNNEHLVAENQKNYGARYVALDEFLNGGALVRVEYSNFNENAQTEIINRINKKIGLTYDLLNYNCEHFVNEVLTGASKSHQVKTGVTLSIGFSLCLLAFGLIKSD